MTKWGMPGYNYEIGYLLLSAYNRVFYEKLLLNSSYLISISFKMIVHSEDISMEKRPCSHHFIQD